jgi:hypothetical protein
MKLRMPGSDVSRSEQFTGRWVALDNCRYDPDTRLPIEGDVVDSDEDVAELCARMREAGRTACAIHFCEDDVLVESSRGSATPTPVRSGYLR